MSIVIIGGHDRMVRQYETICKKHNCKAKIFTQMPSDFENKLGTPDLMVVFTNTCSHKMVRRVNQKSAKHDIPVARIIAQASVRLNPFLINIAGEGAEARYFTAISKPSLTNRALFMIIIPIMADDK